MRALYTLALIAVVSLAGGALLAAVLPHVFAWLLDQNEHGDGDELK